MSQYLKITKDDTHHIIGGATFTWKDEIKKCDGARWSPADKVWRIPIATDIAELLKKTQPVSEEKKASPRKARTKTYGRCCDQAKIESSYYAGPMHYSCPEHGFRATTKKGFGYSGD